MSALPASARAAPVPAAEFNWLVAALGLTTIGLLVTARLADLQGVSAVENFSLVFTSIAVEALPFVLLGAAVSAAIEVFVPGRAFERIATLPRRLQVPGAILGGLAFPVCECGSVPVARRLIRKGMHPSAGLAFMLAAPIINPVVVVSTIVAYQGRGAGEMVAGRVGLGVIVAVSAALLIGRGHAAELIRARALRPTPHQHHHEHAGRPRAFVEHLAGDLMFMGKFVVVGAGLAAALQTAVDQSVFTGVLASPFVGALLMMALAFMLSLCSEADAFVAVSFVQFERSGQLAFLVFGPMIDIKLALLYAAAFGRGFTLRVLIVAASLVLAGSMVFHALVT
jgi:uncharacterized membrane protein YraQ (UPF0718 family)